MGDRIDDGSVAELYDRYIRAEYDVPLSVRPGPQSGDDWDLQ
jgi:hypothetical protein